MRRATLFLSLLVAAVACGKKEPAPEAKPAEAAKPAAAPPAQAATPSPAPAAPAQPAGTTAPPTAAPAVALPGPCVDPVADATKRLAAANNQPEWTRTPGDPSNEPPAPQPGPDVDGDGTPEQLLVGSAGGTVSGVLVYVMRGTCGHYVGDIGGTPQETKNPTRRHGLIDLKSLETSSCEGARCGCTPGESWFRFDGKEYHLDKKASTQSHEKPCKD